MLLSQKCTGRGGVRPHGTTVYLADIVDVDDTGSMVHVYRSVTYYNVAVHTKF